jgi:copper oxidase (laccase) domain-containing protein
MDPRFGTADEVRENRMVLRAMLPELDGAYVITPANAHGFTSVDEDNDQISANPNFQEIDVAAEALITTRKRIGLMLNPADCIPLVYGGSDGSLLSLIHVGWRGAANRFHDEVIGHIKDEFGLHPKEAVAYLGPSISGSSYFTEQLSTQQTDDETWKPHIMELDEGFRVDVPGFVAATLRHIGMKSESIQISPINTANKKNNFFSHVLYKQGTPTHPEPGRNGFIVASF